jgi:hypothetical protein
MDARFQFELRGNDNDVFKVQVAAWSREFGV